MEKHDIPSLFGSKVFDDRAMKVRLSAEDYSSLKKTIDENAKLETAVADAVAIAMCDWALEQGATHFTHWFQPSDCIGCGQCEGICPQKLPVIEYLQQVAQKME